MGVVEYEIKRVKNDVLTLKKYAPKHHMTMTYVSNWSTVYHTFEKSFTVLLEIMTIFESGIKS